MPSPIDGHPVLRLLTWTNEAPGPRQSNWAEIKATSCGIRVIDSEKKIFVDRSKEHIKNAPDFHRDKHLGDAGYREELGTYYRPVTPAGGQPIV
ncbi:hypothetical protein [Streptomyces sp. Ag82_O1-15]|uniref:hypothetical protein n=1 Tax=Streptomyces sp. Ag82_O1-15 TaxID=1938855 RepID=UPI001181008C|nr:hypothetical protein [Streptomyces sp. Ag82_O1-15]